MTITPDVKYAQVGESFTCSADSNPPATYSWKRILGSGGAVTVDGPVLLTNETMVGDNEYQCTAVNSLGSANKSIAFFVGTCTAYTYSLYMLIIAFLTWL